MSKAVPGPGGIEEYYRRITEANIGEVARELLGGRIVQGNERLLQCDCPHHESQSGRSLHVFTDKQGWYCFACGVGGDVLQLVEFIQSGHVTRGMTGLMPESHRRARDYLAQRAELPPLGRYGLSPDKLAEVEASRTLELRVQGVLTAVASIYHDRLKSSPEVLEWLHAHYAISDETIEKLRIGYAVNGAWKGPDGEEHPGVIEALTSAPHEFELRDLAGSGAFWPTAQDTLVPFFENRIVFPYWGRGRVVFLIGRKTPWTPSSEWEEGKYKKLLVHDPDKRAHIAPCIHNGYLYNEDCLLARPERAILTEGVTDCIALMERGFPAISPATVRIRNDDRGRLLAELTKTKTVYVCHDNEVSEVGLKGALETATGLDEHKIEVRLVILPLADRQKSARQELLDRYQIEQGISPPELAKRLEGRPQEETAHVNRLLGDAKIDVNEYFRSGHTAADFEKLLADAPTPIEYAISRLPSEIPEDERNHLLEPILREIAGLPPLEQDRYLRLIQERFGEHKPSLQTLRGQVRAARKERRDEARRQENQKKRRSDAPPGSCQAVIREALVGTEAELSSPDYAAAAEAAFQWFIDHGARYFRTRSGEPFLFFDEEIYWMDTGDRGRRRLYQSIIYEHTDVVPTTTGGKTFFEVLANLAIERGEIRDELSWLHTDVARYTVYFNLNNAGHEIAKITPDGIEVLSNGGNLDGVILAGSRKIAPIQYDPNADPVEAERLLSDLILRNLTCGAGDGALILSWLTCFLLIDFVGTRPMTRFEGPAGSGKTTASKLLSALLYGEPQQKMSTTAANYTDGSLNPLIVLDNVEAKNLTEDLSTFILTSITGITKEKRKGGTDTETVTERTKCLLNTTGIEPLGGELTEVLSRSFVIRFEMDARASDCFLEAKVLAALREHRDLILSVIMKRTRHVLAMLRDGAQEKVMSLLHAALGNHGKRRCNDYFSLMYLMMLAGDTGDEVEAGLKEIDPRFLELLESLDRISGETACESNAIATALAALFKAYHHAVQADEESTAANVSRTNKGAFVEKYQLDFTDDEEIRGALARDLFIALKGASREFGLSFPMRSVQQFAQRFANDLDTIRGAGFEIEVRELPHHRRLYNVRQAGE